MSPVIEEVEIQEVSVEHPFLIQGEATAESQSSDPVVEAEVRRSGGDPPPSGVSFGRGSPSSPISGSTSVFDEEDGFSLVISFRFSG